MKKLLIIVLTIALIITVSACSKEKNTLEKMDDIYDEIEAEKEPQTLEGFIKAYKNVGYEVGEIQNADYERVYADNGIKFEVDGQLIEIYIYNDANDKSDEANNFISNPENNPVMFDDTNVPADVMYSDAYMGIYDVPGFLLLYSNDYKAPIQPINPTEGRPDSVLSVFMQHSSLGPTIIK